MSKADLHMHSTFSDGILTPEQIVLHHRLMNEEYIARGLGKWRDVVAITDHEDIKGAEEAAELVYKQRDPMNPVIIIGEEVTSLDGHILALNIKTKIDRGMSAEETLYAIKEQSGFAVAAHPYALRFVSRGLKGVNSLTEKLPFEGIEILNANVTMRVPNMIARYRTRYSREIALLGSSDAHFPSAYTAWTEFLGDGLDDLLKSIKDCTTIPRGRVYSARELLQGFVRYRRVKEKEGNEALPKMRWETNLGALRFGIFNYASYLVR